jgi:hypothetical protein
MPFIRIKRLLKFHCIQISLSDLEKVKNHKKARSAAAGEQNQGMVKNGKKFSQL